MACQPAVEVGIFLPMTFDALAHAPAFVWKAVQIGNLPVTLLAGDFAVNVTLVIKQHVFSHVIDLDPWSRFLVIEIAVFFLDPRMFDDDVIVTVQTLFHRRNARKI